MWDDKYEPPKSVFDEIEPVACTVFLIAMFAIIPFTPLSPFSSREPSAFDRFAGVNALAETRMLSRYNTGSPAAQVEAKIESSTATR